MRTLLLDDLAHQARAIVRLSGPDTPRFVQGTISANVEPLADAVAVTAALCTVKGKLVSELVVLPAGSNTIDLLVPRDVAAAVAESLDRHIIMDDVEVAPPADTSVGIAWDGDEHAPAPTIVGEGIRTFATRHPGPGRLVLGARDAVLAALASGDATDANGWAARRIATATPAWGHEITADVFPPEVGFVHAVSYDKGCFMGQEPLARIHARGQVNRVLVRVKLASDPGEAPAPLVDDAGTQVGRLTTWAPGGDAFLGLAIVRRKVAVAGHVLRTDAIVAEVIAGPLGDDPGVGNKKRSGTVKLGRRG
ncbi:MAG: hypothetical protein JKY37_13040 [Nannocystaceae bacterium]|nr:hypothetical protein [Nannocystaceae bacterium]